MTKGNSKQLPRFQSQSWADLSYKLERIREAARRDRRQKMTSLMHHISPRLLLDSYNRHEWLMKFLSHRIADQRMLRLIRKWLTAGISEDGQWSETKVGTPQGAVISPLLANIFLHYVLDLWVNDWRKKKAEGDIIIVRYADDFVLGFQCQGEAQRFLQDLRERMRKFALELHDGKTRLIEFGRFAQSNRKKKGEGSPETFTFLGFTHACSQTRKGNRFKIQRIPKAKGIRNMLRKIKKELMDKRHDHVPEQGKWLRTTVQGFLNYFAVPGCSYVLSVFRAQVNRIWWKALRRRSHKAKSLSWARMKKLIKTWVPYVRILHPYPGQRLRLT